MRPLKNEQSTTQPSSMLSTFRNPQVRPQWSVAIVLIVVLGVALTIASGLGDASRAVYTLFPALLTVLFGLAAGARAGILLGAVTTALVTLAAFASVTPLVAALVFATVLLWLSLPTRLAPSASIAPLLRLAYFAVAAFGKPGVSTFEALVFALAGLVGGMLLVLMMRTAARIARRPRGEVVEPHEDEGPQPKPVSQPTPSAMTPANILGLSLAAAVSAALLYWRLSAESQTAAWVLLTSMLVFQPTHAGTLRQSLGRVMGTVLGFVVATVLFAVLPEGLAAGIGLASLVPAVAYPKRDYVLSVAATTVAVVTMYGVPEGAYLAWGLQRTIDTLIGASIAVALSVLVRMLEAPRPGTESV